MISQLSTSQVKNDTINKTSKDSLFLKPDKKLKFGCGFGLNFVGGTSLSISPNLNYSLSEKTSFTVGLQTSYNEIKNLQKTFTYGANAGIIYAPIKKINLMTEIVQLKVKTTSEVSGIQSTKEFWDTALFAGLGYNITNKISVGAKYNFLYKKGESVYSTPIIPFVNIVF